MTKKKKSPLCSKTLTHGRATGNSFLRSGKMNIWGMTEFYWLSKGEIVAEHLIIILRTWGYLFQELFLKPSIKLATVIVLPTRTL